MAFSWRRASALRTVHSLREETEAGGRKVKASKDEPQYLVKSDKSGGEAVHKPGALDKQ